MHESPTPQPPIEPLPQSGPSRWRQLGGKMLDFLNPTRVQRRELEAQQAALEAQQQAARLAEETRQIAEQTRRREERDRFLAYLGESIVVTTIVGANEFRFLSQQGNQLHESVLLPTRGQATLLGNSLTDMYLTFDSGTYPIEDIATTLNLTRSRASRAAGNLAAIMPKQVITYDSEQGRITFGNITIASRKADAQARTAYLSRVEAARWKERHDKDKVDLGEHDHILVATERRRFYLPLGTTELILAARTLQALGQYAKGDEPNGREIALTVWTLMPTMERELFTDIESEVIGKISIIDVPVINLLNTLTGRLGMTNQLPGLRFRVGTVPKVSFRADPVAASQTATLAPVFPPGTPLHIIEDFRSNYIPPENIAMAQHAIKNLLPKVTKITLEHEDAIALLDFIMSQAGKRALQVELAASGSRRSLQSVHKSLRRVVKDSLGSGYTSARRARTIAGNRMTAGPKHTGGALPKTTKWYIGIRGAAEEGRHKPNEDHHDS